MDVAMLLLSHILGVAEQVRLPRLQEDLIRDPARG